MMHQPPRTPDARRQDAIERRWQEAAPLTVGDPAFVYLWSRGLVLPLRDMPPHLRYHARLPYRHDDGTLTYHPAMLARVDNPEAAVVTLHRTYLRNDGSKAHVPTVKKLMPCALGGASAGGAIRLYPAGETLAVTEGIETALAVRLFTGLPVWAAISATGMEQVILPDHVETVMICGDHDDPGIRAAQALAQRLIAQGRIVTIRVPRRPRTDWADETSCANAFCNMALEIKPREPAAEDHPLDSGALPKQRPSVRTAVQAALATHVTARVRRTL